MRVSDIFKLILAIVICELAGVIGSVFTADSVSTWYVTLAKPVFNPPNWLFGPVWTLLYLLMGISLWLVWRSKSKFKSIAIWFFSIQLLLNILWSIIFFGLKSLLGALIEIILLWALIIITIILFHRISKTAAWILLPYILWVTFAAILNFSIWLLN